jgi:hypothetical protein
MDGMVPQLTAVLGKIVTVSEKKVKHKQRESNYIIRTKQTWRLRE